MPFSVPEQAVLLGLDDTTGKCISSHTQYAWAASLLAELAIEDRIDLTGPVIRVIDPSPSGDEIVDEALRSLSKRPQGIMAAIRGTLVERGRDRTLRRLVEAGILEYADNRVLGIFHFRRYPSHDSAVEKAIRGRLRAAVLSSEPADRRTSALVAIADGSGLLGTFLSPEERRRWRLRIDQFTAVEPVGKELRRVVEEEEAAMTTITIIAATS